MTKLKSIAEKTSEDQFTPNIASPLPPGRLQQYYNTLKTNT